MKFPAAARSIAFAIALTAFASTATATTQEPAPKWVITENVSYRFEPISERCVLDIYHPDPPPNPAACPVVVWFHGGGLTGGEKHIPDELKNSGLIVVAANYRLLPEHNINQTIDDAAAAVAWTFRNIGEYGGDPAKIFVAGHSAGGYLTSMIGLDLRYLARYSQSADSIRGLFPLSGQAITHYAHRAKQGLKPTQATIDEYAPLAHVRPDAPPLVIISGDREMELYGRYEETAYFWRMMRLAGHPAATLYELNDFDHGAMVAPGLHIVKNHIREILETK